MKVSVITSCYNAGATIEDTILSVLSQEGIELEYIIIDGASTDDTMEILDMYKNWITTIVSEPDQGMYFALNKGLALATGDFIAFLHADDVFASKDVLKLVAEAFEKLPTETVYGNLKYVNRNDLDKVVRSWDSGSYKKAKWRKGWMPPHPSFFAKKKCYERWGDFNTSFKSAADYELMLRFLFKNSASSQHIPMDCVLMRTGGKSNITWQNRLLANREDVRAWTVNGIKPPIGLAVMKPLRKLGQFIFK
jgi:glycosyltransferase involved in cell wall biosynthesis